MLLILICRPFIVSLIIITVLFNGFLALIASFSSVFICVLINRNCTPVLYGTSELSQKVL